MFRWYINHPLATDIAIKLENDTIIFKQASTGLLLKLNPNEYKCYIAYKLTFIQCCEVSI